MLSAIEHQMRRAKSCLGTHTALQAPMLQVASRGWRALEQCLPQIPVAKNMLDLTTFPHTNTHLYCLLFIPQMYTHPHTHPHTHTLTHTHPHTHPPEVETSELKLILHDASGLDSCPENVLNCRHIASVTYSVQTVQVTEGREERKEREKGGGKEGGKKGGRGEERREERREEKREKRREEKMEKRRVGVGRTAESSAPTNRTKMDTHTNPCRQYFNKTDKGMQTQSQTQKSHDSNQNHYKTTNKDEYPQRTKNPQRRLKALRPGNQKTTILFFGAVPSIFAGWLPHQSSLQTMKLKIIYSICCVHNVSYYEPASWLAGMYRGKTKTPSDGSCSERNKTTGP